MTIYVYRLVEQRRHDRRRPVAPDESESQVDVHERQTVLRDGRQAQRSDHAADQQRHATLVVVQRVHHQAKRAVVVVTASAACNNYSSLLLPPNHTPLTPLTRL